jgi:hypothetical protein
MPPERGTRAERVRAAAVAVIAVVAVVLPLRRGLADDSLPLSNYPMFTAKRAQVTSIERAIGVSAGGDEHVLSPELTGGTVEVIQAAQTVFDAIRNGTAEELCDEIAARVEATGDERTAEVLVVTERFDVVTALRADDPEPVERRIHARCGVER